MAYQALYRKYRSQRFDEMVGQEVVATTLKNAIVNGQISHAYLFTGPRGTGKTSAARIFAKAINCSNQKDGEPCNTCDICQAINHEALDDIIELDAASNNGVDQIREVIEKSTYAATCATYKVYIIDEVHMLTSGAFNALLKTLEEPPAGVVFVLATTELQKVPATIVSRVQRFAFKAITTADIRAHLAEVLSDEGLAHDERSLDVIARAAEGGMRDALSLLDQALSFSDGAELTEEDALLVTGAIADAALQDYVSAVARHDAPSALNQLQAIFDEGKNMLRFAEDLLAHLRDQLLDATSSIPHENLYRWIDIAIDSLRVLREASQQKIAADVMTMKLCAERESVQSADKGNEVSHSRDREQLTMAAKPVETPRQTVTAPVVSSDAPVKAGETASSENSEPVKPVEKPSSETSEAAKPVVKPSSEMPAAVKPVVKPQASIDLVKFLQNDADRAVKQQFAAQWPDIAASLSSPRDRALFKGMTLEAASNQQLVVSVASEPLITAIQSAGLTEHLIGQLPQLTIVTKATWNQAVQDFMAQRNGGQVATPETEPLPVEPPADTRAAPDNSETTSVSPDSTAVKTSDELVSSDTTPVKPSDAPDSSEIPSDATSDAPNLDPLALFGDIVEIKND